MNTIITKLTLFTLSSAGSLGGPLFLLLLLRLGPLGLCAPQTPPWGPFGGPQGGPAPQGSRDGRAIASHTYYSELQELICRLQFALVHYA